MAQVALCKDSLPITGQWVSAKEACELLGVSKGTLHKHRVDGKYTVREVYGNGGLGFQFFLPSLPVEAQQRYAEKVIGKPLVQEVREDEADLQAYSNAPAWARAKADKYCTIIQQTAGLKGSELREFINQWNAKHPESKTSYPRVCEARKTYESQGVSGLLARYGKTAGRTIIKEDHYKVFETAFLKEGSPSAKSCWVQTLGAARAKDPQLSVADFPSVVSFVRLLESRVPKSAIYRARHGEAAWNRRYANYIDRDYSNVAAGECAVADHMQHDVCVLNPYGKPVFPWITAWADFKTSKWLGWCIHWQDPNSDHIFQSFYRMSSAYGLVKRVLLDNGRDFRCRDFAGGRRNHRVNHDTGKSTTMLSALGIEARFALPYGAQTKPIERQFLKNKELISKQLVGYRGGNVTERPEILKHEIKSGAILKWDEYVALMDKAIVEIINRMPSNGKALLGKSPDQLWEEEAPALRRPQNLDALKLFCMRCSTPVTITRNGVLDSDLKVRYWSEWMSGMKGEKVYLRRDIKAYQEAWVFRASDDEYLGKGILAEAISAFAQTGLEKAQLKAALASKRADKKITESYIANLSKPSASEVISRMTYGTQALGEMRGYTPKEQPVSNVIAIQETQMDVVLRIEKSLQEEGRSNFSALVPSAKPKEKIVLFECDLPETENQQIAVAG